jgi:hypothetical protein
MFSTRLAHNVNQTGLGSRLEYVNHHFCSFELKLIRLVVLTSIDNSNGWPNGEIRIVDGSSLSCQ